MISGRNIHNLTYADDTTLITEREEELRRVLIKLEEEAEKAGFQLSLQKSKDHGTGQIVSWQTVGERVETVRDYFGGFQNHCRW